MIINQRMQEAFGNWKREEKIPSRGYRKEYSSLDTLTLVQLTPVMISKVHTAR